MCMPSRRWAARLLASATLAVVLLLQEVTDTSAFVTGSEDAAALLQQSVELKQALEPSAPRGKIAEARRSSLQTSSLPQLALVTIEAGGHLLRQEAVQDSKQSASTDVRKAKVYRMQDQLAIPSAAVLLGSLLIVPQSCRTAGKLVLFFGAMTGINIFMKALLSNSSVSPERNLSGMPAAFAITLFQQVVGFMIVVTMIGVAYPTPWRYSPQVLTTGREWVAVVLFSLTFTLSIGLNNFSLSLLDMSVNLMIRSCCPIFTWIVEYAFAHYTGGKGPDTRWQGVTAMAIGVVCAGALVTAKSAHGGSVPIGDSKHFVLGVIVCMFSILCASVNLVIAGVLGTSMKMNPVDMTLYMALPATLFLLVPVFFFHHPISWPGYGLMTDWAIIKEVAVLSPGTFGLAVFSGFPALVYNILVFNIVESLSPTFAAFAGNFNKAATIGISLIAGLELLPPGHWGSLMIFGILGNTGSFALYSFIQAEAKSPAKKAGEGKGAALPAPSAVPRFPAPGKA